MKNARFQKGELLPTIVCDVCQAEFTPRNGKAKRCPGADGILSACQKEAIKKNQYLRSAVKKVSDIRFIRRICIGMMCRGEKYFYSRHKYNRICNYCKRKSGWDGKWNL